MVKKDELCEHKLNEVEGTKKMKHMMKNDEWYRSKLGGDENLYHFFTFLRAMSKVSVWALV